MGAASAGQGAATQDGEGPRGARERHQDTAGLRTIVAAIADGIAIVGTDGVVRFVNPAASALLGRSAEALVGSAFGFPLGSADGQEIDVLPAAGEGGAPRVAELRVVETAWEGEPAFLVSLRDVTERREAAERQRRLAAAEAARREAERGERDARLLADAGLALDGARDADATARCLADVAVPEVAEWCVVSIADGRGVHRVAALAHARPERTRALAQLLERRGAWDGGAGLGAGPPTPDDVADDGADSVVTVDLVARGARLGVAAFGRADGGFDARASALVAALAERAALALANAQLLREAQSASRAKSEFLTTMSHELRTPLNAIGGYAELIALGLRGPVTEAQRADLERLQRNQRHLLDMIDEILDYAHIEHGRTEYEIAPVLVARAVAEARASLPDRLEDGGLTYREHGDATATVHADRRKLVRVLRNLLSNASRFTDRGGAVTTEWLAQGDAIVIAVRDSGIGIPATQLGRVFEPFVQADQRLTRTRGGAGLGLAVSRELVRGMGGELSVESVEGVGSCFLIHLPAA